MSVFSGFWEICVVCKRQSSFGVGYFFYTEWLPFECVTINLIPKENQSPPFFPVLVLPANSSSHQCKNITTRFFHSWLLSLGHMPRSCSLDDAHFPVPHLCNYWEASHWMNMVQVLILIRRLLPFLCTGRQRYPHSFGKARHGSKPDAIIKTRDKWRNCKFIFNTYIY